MEQHFLFRDTQMQPKIASYYGMFAKNRNRLIKMLEDATIDMLDYTPNPENVESIGTLLLHIVAVEWGWIFGDIDGSGLKDLMYGSMDSIFGWMILNRL